MGFTSGYRVLPSFVGMQRTKTGGQSSSFWINRVLLVFSHDLSVFVQTRFQAKGNPTGFYLFLTEMSRLVFAFTEFSWVLPVFFTEFLFLPLIAVGRSAVSVIYIVRPTYTSTSRYLSVHVHPYVF